VVIGTKFGFRFKDGKQVGAERASRSEHIREAVEGSLRRLKVFKNAKNHAFSEPYAAHVGLWFSLCLTVRKGSKAEVHLAVLQRMSTEAHRRYQPRYKILGCFALLHAVRSGMPPKPAPIRRGLRIRSPFSALASAL
jgi:hypothetical protein